MPTDITRTELVWPGKYDEDGRRREVDRVSLPFQVIERVNESRATREAEKSRNPTLFDVWQGDSAETFEDGWRNKLIWGDNKLVMSSLLDQFAGKIDLIYVDPPFATGADFSFSAPIGEGKESIDKEQSLIEEKAYRDTWGDGLPSYLSMLWDRLTLIHALLAPTGTLYLHLGYQVAPFAKLMLDDLFGTHNQLNEVVWCYREAINARKHWNRKHDTILVYTRSDQYTFRPERALSEASESTVKKYKFVDDEGRRYRLMGRGLSGSPIKSARDVAPEWERTHPELVYRHYMTDGTLPVDYWIIDVINQASHERAYYPTQKPEALLQRIVEVSSEPDDLVADFFCGSGTTGVVAEKLGRRWLHCDLGKYAIHTTRKRLLGVENCRPFEVLNLGKYERTYWAVATFGEDLDDDGLISLYEYVAFILKLYGATPAAGMQHLHGKVGTAFVHVGAVDSPVTIDEIVACVDECVALKAKELHILGWEWEMGLHDPISDDAKRRGVRLVLRQIPREVMEQQAAAKGDVEFFELAYLDVEIKPTRKKLEMVAKLKNFVIPNPELVPDDVRSKIKQWSDYVDYWAVDWNFSDDTFIQGWVTYRTRKNRALDLESDAHLFDVTGTYNVMVKVIDIFGNDTSKIIPVKVS
jgi:adenine-specific DNA-methyltransferase